MDKRFHYSYVHGSPGKFTAYSDFHFIPAKVTNVISAHRNVDSSYAIIVDCLVGRGEAGREAKGVSVRFRNRSMQRTSHGAPVAYPGICLGGALLKAWLRIQT